MRAVWLRSFGPPSVLNPAESPEPADERAIDVELANVTFVETQIRAGRSPFPVTLPMIPGNGVGGPPAPRRVVASLNGSGGYAERAVPGELFEVPDELALDHAVALLADGRTAMLVTETAALRPGERVLVLAAAGGVGTLLVQLAVAAGCEVVAAASTEAKRDLAASLGAAVTTGYENLKGPGPFNFVLDGVGGEVARAAFEQLAPEGRMVSFGMASGAWVDVGADPRLLRAGRPGREHTERALASGLKPVIGQRFPLEGAAEAHAAIEARATVGKTLLIVGS